MNLIDRDALIDYIVDADSLLNEFLPVGEYEPFGDAFCEVINVIRSATPVVRCKDCKWQDPADMSSGYTWCDMLCRQMRETDFCSNGKEKDT